MPEERRVAVQMEIGQAYKRHTAIFAGIHDYARQQSDWRLIIDEWADHTLPGRGSKPSPYDGLVGRISELGARRTRRLNIPAVNVWFNSPVRDLPAVHPDLEACGRVRAEHLLSRGFRNFGVVFHQPYRASVAEADAFERTVREAGCDEFSNVTEGRRDGALNRRNETYRDWQRSVHCFDRWLDSLKLPVGLFIYHIDTARVIIEMCRNRGWRVPEDVAIVAGSNEETICERPEPSVTSLELPYEQVGFEAARLLDRLMDEKANGKSISKDSTKHETILLPPVGVVARRSTDFHAVDDLLVRRVLRFIDENLHRPLTIDTLANAANVSRRTLTNHFRDKLQRTVAGEIKRLRIERVKRELTATNQPIKQIAHQAGFGSPRTLNDVFRSEIGCSPREFRKERSRIKD
jgi:LacI family transcriptional regulator